MHCMSGQASCARHCGCGKKCYVDGQALHVHLRARAGNAMSGCKSITGASSQGCWVLAACSLARIGRQGMRNSQAPRDLQMRKQGLARTKTQDRKQWFCLALKCILSPARLPLLKQKRSAQDQQGLHSTGQLLGGSPWSDTPWKALHYTQMFCTLTSGDWHRYSGCIWQGQGCVICTFRIICKFEFYRIICRTILQTSLRILMTLPKMGPVMYLFCSVCTLDWLQIKNLFLSTVF